MATKMMQLLQIQVVAALFLGPPVIQGLIQENTSGEKLLTYEPSTLVVEEVSAYIMIASLQRLIFELDLIGIKH